VDKNCWTLQGSISETNQQHSRLADQKWHLCNWIGWCWCNDLQRLLGPDYELSTDCTLCQEYAQKHFLCGTFMWVLISVIYLFSLWCRLCICYQFTARKTVPTVLQYFFSLNSCWCSFHHTVRDLLGSILGLWVLWIKDKDHKSEELLFSLCVHPFSSAWQVMFSCLQRTPVHAIYMFFVMYRWEHWIFRRHAHGKKL
jgi:hypothetical protein